MKNWFWLLVSTGLFATLLALALQPQFIHEAPYLARNLQDIQQELALTKQLLDAYAKKHGQYPDNSQGLSAVRDDALSAPPEMMIDLSRPDTLVYSKNNYRIPARFLLSGGAGMYSRMLGLILYENRKGLPPALFAFSPVTADNHRDYSLEVAPEIYLCLPNAAKIANLHRTLWWKEKGYWIGVILTGFLFLSQLKKTVSWVLRIGAIVLALYPASQQFRITCYAMGVSFFGNFSKEAQEKHEALLREYESRGIIPPDAAQKLRERIQRDRDRMENQRAELRKKNP